jgi:uncharacterized protein YraI
MPAPATTAYLSMTLGLAIAATALPVSGAHACACCGTWRVANVTADDALNVRSGPGTAYGVVTTLQPDEGCIVKTGQRHGNWVRIEAIGMKGWVNRRYLAYIR